MFKKRCRRLGQEYGRHTKQHSTTQNTRTRRDGHLKINCFIFLTFLFVQMIPPKMLSYSLGTVNDFVFCFNNIIKYMFRFTHCHCSLVLSTFYNKRVSKEHIDKELKFFLMLLDKCVRKALTFRCGILVATFWIKSIAFSCE